MENTPQDNSNSLETLEDTSTTVGNQTGGAGSSSTPSGSGDNKPSSTNKPGLGKRAQGLITHVNIYLLFFILIVVIAVVVVFIGVQRSKKDAATPTINTTPLTQDALDKLKGSDAKVGDPKQTLSIESNAIFSGKVLIRDSLDVAGTIKVGGPLSLPGLTVSGTSAFDQIAGNKLTISGDANIQGQLNVQKSLTIAGGATFGGSISAPSININSLQLNGDLPVAFHIDAGGSTPSKSDGTALGIGGTSSISGTDTAGTISINTGGSPPAGCFTNVTFARKFNGVPHVVVTPVGASGGSVTFYVNRTTTTFSVCASTPPPASSSFSFDYIVID